MKQFEIIVIFDGGDKITYKTVNKIEVLKSILTREDVDSIECIEIKAIEPLQELII